MNSISCIKHRAKETTCGTHQDQPDHTKSESLDQQHRNGTSARCLDHGSEAQVLSRGNRALGRVLVPSTVEASCESLFSRRTSSIMLSSSPASSASRNSIRRRSLCSPSPGSWIPEGSQPREPLVGRASSKHCNVRLASRYPM